MTSETLTYDRMYAQVAQCLVIAMYEDLAGDALCADLVAVARKPKAAQEGVHLLLFP